MKELRKWQSISIRLAYIDKVLGKEFEYSSQVEREIGETYEKLLGLLQKYYGQKIASEVFYDVKWKQEDGKK